MGGSGMGGMTGGGTPAYGGAAGFGDTRWWLLMEW